MTAEQSPMNAAREAWLERAIALFGLDPGWDIEVTEASFEAGWTAAMARQIGDRCYCPCTDCRGLLQDRAARAAGKNWDYEDDPYE